MNTTPTTITPGDALGMPPQGSQAFVVAEAAFVGVTESRFLDTLITEARQRKSNLPADMPGVPDELLLEAYHMLRQTAMERAKLTPLLTGPLDWIWARGRREF